ncbi:MAG TPA: hypothetical protein VF857_09460, partial [Spirochaetota bacterium]
DLYHAGFITLTSLLLTAGGGVMIIATGIILNKIRIALYLRQFAVFFIIVAVVCLLLPAISWLPVFTALITLLFIEGIFLGIAVRAGRLYDAELSYKYSPKMAFVGVKDALAIHYQPTGNRISSLFRKRIARYLELSIDGTDSVHCETLTSEKIPLFIENNSVRDTIPVTFTLRGHDKKGRLHGSISLKKPYLYFFPWRQRITWNLPEIPVLSTTFAPLAGKTVVNRLDDRMKRRATRRESRIRTDAFLHLGAFAPGEPLAQIDFRASLRAGEIMSRKFAHTIDLSCLVAVGFGRRARASNTGELLIGALGRVLSENVSSGIASEVVLFDMAKRIDERLGHGSQRALHFGSDVAELNPTHYEEDEYSILDGMKSSIRDYTHLRILVSWGGTFDTTRAISVASLFRKQGVQCEIQIIAPDVLTTIEERKDSDTSRFFLQLMEKYTQDARSAGVTLVWNKQ